MHGLIQGEEWVPVPPVFAQWTPEVTCFEMGFLNQLQVRLVFTGKAFTASETPCWDWGPRDSYNSVLSAPAHNGSHVRRVPV